MPAKVGIKSFRCAGGCILFVYGCSYPAAIVFDQTHVLYDTKFWREKILANLANYKGFAKIFLSKIFSFD